MIEQVNILFAFSTEPQLSMYRAKFVGGILWCFSERTSVLSKELDAVNLNIRYHEGVPVGFQNPRGEPCPFILNYLLNDAYSI